uniref:Vesicle transport v-SNARE N-terminal domain-containing protein n=1 Tax=Aegilops tauschii subsp. strangulata TaxID=200361 RepID=A0A453EXG5_AEGTS
MTDVFQGYERQYCEISASLSRKCTAAASQEGEKLKQKASEIKSGIDGAEALVPFFFVTKHISVQTSFLRNSIDL